MSMEGTYLCKCDLCGEEFPATETISIAYKDGHTSNLCNKCDEFVCKFNELGHGYYASATEIRDVLARYPAENTLENTRTDAHHHTVYEKDNPTVDIHKIIDDAMEKGDRSVYILIHSGCMSVTINPYVEEKTQWIEGRDRLWLTCSNCGRPLKEREWTPFCPNCGEQMHGVRREKTDENP